MGIGKVGSIILPNMQRIHILQFLRQCCNIQAFAAHRAGGTGTLLGQNHLINIELGAFRSSVNLDRNIEIDSLSLICYRSLGDLLIGGDPLAAMIHTNIGVVRTQVCRNIPSKFVEMVLAVDRDCAALNVYQPFFTAIVIAIGCGQPVTHRQAFMVVCLTQRRICVFYQSRTHFMGIGKVARIKLFDVLRIQTL